MKYPFKLTPDKQKADTCFSHSTMRKIVIPAIRAIVKMSEFSFMTLSNFSIWWVNFDNFNFHIKECAEANQIHIQNEKENNNSAVSVFVLDVKCFHTLSQAIQVDCVLCSVTKNHWDRTGRCAAQLLIFVYTKKKLKALDIHIWIWSFELGNFATFNEVEKTSVSCASKQLTRHFFFS